jgi:thiamine-phosphate pyrophosphorylase
VPLPSRLYVICDADVCGQAGWTLVDFATACLDGGATFLQIRAKQAASGRFLEWSSAIVERARRFDALVVVNDRADVARVAGAGGVHVGQEDLAPALVRAVCGDQMVVGLSTHTMPQLASALAEAVDYVAVGPVFGTKTKATGYDAVGLAHVTSAVVRASRGARRLPVVAIGGITLDRAADVILAGAASVAVISDLLATGDPAARVGQFLAALGARP